MDKIGVESGGAEEKEETKGQKTGETREKGNAPSPPLELFDLAFPLSDSTTQRIVDLLTPIINNTFYGEEENSPYETASTASEPLSTSGSSDFPPIPPVPLVPPLSGPLTPRNEAEIHRRLLFFIDMMLRRFPTTLRQDVNLLHFTAAERGASANLPRGHPFKKKRPRAFRKTSTKTTKKTKKAKRGTKEAQANADPLHAPAGKPPKRPLNPYDVGQTMLPTTGLERQLVLLRAETKRVLLFGILECIRSIHRADAALVRSQIEEGRLTPAQVNHWRQAKVEPWKEQWERWHSELETTWDSES